VFCSVADLMNIHDQHITAIIMYNVCVNVTVVIEHIVLLTAARALVPVGYVSLRLFFCLSFLSLLPNCVCN